MVNQKQPLTYIPIVVHFSPTSFPLNLLFVKAERSGSGLGLGLDLGLWLGLGVGVRVRGY